MAKTILDIYNASDLSSKIDKSKSKTPITKSKLSDKELEQARNGAVPTTRYSDTPRG